MDTVVAGDRPARHDRWIVGVAALVSLLLSPITVIWAVVLGTVPYFALAVVQMF